MTPRMPIPLSSPALAERWWSASGGTEGSSPLLPRASGGGAEQREAEGVFSGCHHSPQSGAVVFLQPPKHTTARLRREWCHPETSTHFPSPRGVAGETSPAQAINCGKQRQPARRCIG